MKDRVLVPTLCVGTALRRSAAPVCHPAPAPMCRQPVTQHEKATVKIYNLQTVGLVGEDGSLAEELAGAVSRQFLSPHGYSAELLARKLLVVSQTPEVIAQIDDLLQNVQTALGCDKAASRDKAEAGALIGEWLVSILPRVAVANDKEVAPLYVPEKGLLFVVYAPEVIERVDQFFTRFGAAMANAMKFGGTVKDMSQNG